MATFTNDTFTGTTGDFVINRPGELGATWTVGTGYSGMSSPLITNNRARANTSGGMLIVASGVASADGEYAEAIVETLTTASSFAICTRSFANLAGVLRGYAGYYSNSSGSWQIRRFDSYSSSTQIGSSGTFALSVGSHTVRLTATGTGASVALELIVDGTTVITTSDASASRLTTYGSAGVYFDTTNSASAGTHISSIIGADSASSGPSLSLSGPSSGAVGAASTNFTAALTNGTGAVAFTPTSDSGTGSFTPTVVNLSVGTPTGTFTYTPTSAGSRNINGTNDAALSAPTSVAYNATSSDGITQTEQTSNKNYQRSGTSANVTFGGTYSGTTPTSVEVRIVTTAGATVQDWTALGSATISGGNWSGSLSVPQGGMYNFLSRSKNGATVLVTSAQSANPFGVGAIFTVCGQSNGNKMFSVGSGTPLATVSAYNWATLTGAGAVTLANALSTALSIPVTLINTAVDGAGLCSSTGASAGSWDNTSGSLYTNWQTKVTAVGGKIEGVFWLQGEWDAGQNVAKSLYKSTLQTLIASMRSHTGQASLPFFVAPLTRYTGGTFAGWDNVQDAFMEVFSATVPKACDTWDLSSDDGLHYNAAGQVTLGGRLALAARKYLGQSVESLGPVVAGAAAAGAVVDVTFTHLSGTDITPSSGITGLTFTDNGGSVTPTSVVRQSANVVRATFATSLATPVYAAVAVGTNPDATAPIKDSAGLPAQRTVTAGVLATAKTVSMTLTTDGSTPAASLSGLKWAFFDNATPDAFSAPAAKGTGETTDASGVITIPIGGSALSHGGVGWLIVTDSDGTTTQSPAHKAFSGPAAVTVS